MRYFHTQIWHDKVICTIQRTSPQVTPEDRKEKHTEAKTQVDDKEPAVSLTSCSYSMYPNPLGFPALLVTSRISLILPCCNKKNALYLSVSVCTGPSHVTWSSEPREGPATCKAKVVPSFLSYFKTLSIGPVPEIEPATSCSAVKRSTDWANPAAVKNINSNPLLLWTLTVYCQEPIIRSLHLCYNFESTFPVFLFLEL